MQKNESDVLIIGAGLTGLTLAYLLKNTNLKVTILEARDRIGGRIKTLYWDKNQPLEMGATWLGSQHQELNALLQKLDIKTFEQQIGKTAIYEAISTSPHYLANLPHNDNPTLRICGGTQTLLDALCQRINPTDVHLLSSVKSITKDDTGVTVKTKSVSYHTKLVVSTLPPNLLTHSIKIDPELSPAITDIACETHTWMGESIKIALTYNVPFWRTEKLSGTIFSNVGPIPEMYDHSNYEDNFYALKGFFNGNYFQISKEERLAMVLTQLNKYYGPLANDYLTYEETVWAKEQYTYAPYKAHVLPHQNNGNSIFQHIQLDGHLILGGAETALQYPGYMEGAIQSAHRIFKMIRE